MRRVPAALAAVAAVSVAARSAAQERAVPFWPDAVPDAIHAEVDGVAALRTVRDLGRFHRVHGWPGFAAAAELVFEERGAAGFVSDYPNQRTAWSGDVPRPRAVGPPLAIPGAEHVRVHGLAAAVPEASLAAGRRLETFGPDAEVDTRLGGATGARC